MKGDESLVVAPIRSWHTLAPCRDLPELEWFPAEWEVRPAGEVTRVCDGCPFNSRCLQDALDFPNTDGVRGGTVPYQRRQLLAERERARCPRCQHSDSVISYERYEICVSCGTSWPV
jgi:hypothetical protein